MPRVAFHTLGCKVNQYETQKMAEDFRARGFELVGFRERADVYVVNSCTVTSTADGKSRQAARSARHRNPRALVVVTGCYAETSPDAAGAVDGVALVVGNQDKERIVDHVEKTLVGGLQVKRRSAGAAADSHGRTRALIKVQDGCDQFCSYCAVPFARPVMYSRPAAEVLREAEELAARGFKEVVLTGIRLGRYEGAGAGLTYLIESIARLPGIERIRLSSVELTDLPAALLGLMAKNAKVCRHLHVPLQSGDDDVLAAMNRPYTSGEFAEFAAVARERVPDIAITTDVMVGFPGETERRFENTCRLLEKIEFARVHVFRYSPRPKTAASRLADDVSPAEKGRRSRLLMELAARHSAAFAARFVGAAVPVLIEGKKSPANLRSGLTDNYIRIVFDAGRHRAGEIVNVKIEGVPRGQAVGTIVEDADAGDGGG